ncbi:GAF domain-containing protein [Larkinella soli]|uniref:GAF domain-containing protein n=1 Tax=Larkinella soli TaxID=1770527 RepID=UPI000FFB8B34|nr:GAF domain-containing protein [Larkinella soli]
MKAAPLPDNEPERLKALQDYHLLDTLPEEVFDEITRIATEICRTPISLISLVDENRQWFKSRQRLKAEETPRDQSFCAHAILDPDKVMVVSDARQDERFFDNPLTTGYPNVVFYAGAPLLDSEGHALGSLCVIDNRPRTLTENQLLSLKSLAKLVMAHFELRKKQMELLKKQQELDEANRIKNNFKFFLINHLNPTLRTMEDQIEGLFSSDPAPEQMARVRSLKESGNELKTAVENLMIEKQ